MKHWLHAFRLRTLPLAVSSILVGSALAYVAESVNYNGAPQFRMSVLVLALITAILLQILSNLANDLGDHQHGTDNGNRVGPMRAVQSGAITPERMKRAMFICGALALISGCTLITVALGFTMKTLLFLVLGLVAIGAAVKYTFGTRPYGYAGLGDLSVFLFFGIVGVCGTFHLQTRGFAPTDLLWALVLPSVAFGLLSTGVLNVNNMRDIHNDTASGKRTLVVRMGSAKAKWYHTFLVVGGLAALVIFAWMMLRWQTWLFLLVVPGFIIHLKKIWTAPEPRVLDPQLKVLAMGTFLTALLFSLGLILAV